MSEAASRFFASAWLSLMSNFSNSRLQFRMTQGAALAAVANSGSYFANGCVTAGHFLAHQTFLICLINTGLEISIAIFEQEEEKIFIYAVIALICGVITLFLSFFEFIHKGLCEGAKWRHGLLVYPASHGHPEQRYGSAVQAVGFFSAMLHVILAAVDCVKRHYRWSWHIRFRIFPLAFVAVESATRFMHMRGHSGAVYVNCNHGDQPREVLARAVRYGDARIVDCVHLV